MVKEGQVVMVYPLSKVTPALGTFIGVISNNQIQVLMPDGIIFTGNSKEIGEAQ